MKVSCLVAAVAMLALVAAPAAVEAAAPASISITMNSVTVVGSTVTVNVTNNPTSVKAKIDVQVVAYKCTGAFLPQVDCTQEAVGSSSASLAAGQTADFVVSLTIPSGNYIFVAKAVGSKGSAEDKKLGFVGAAVP